MKIIAIARALNEEDRIQRFCRCYSWADRILIADGGSTDRTVQRALRFQNTEVHFFNEMVEKNGHTRNPHGRHINYLIEWAKDEMADWIIFDDVDCVPNRYLQRGARKIFENMGEHLTSIFALRVHIRETEEGEFYYPKLNEPGQSLWAWRADKKVHASEKDPFRHHMLAIPPKSQRLTLLAPLLLLHFCWDDERIQKKLALYNGVNSGGWQHPDKYAGEMKRLPVKWRKL